MVAAADAGSAFPMSLFPHSPIFRRARRLSGMAAALFFTGAAWAGGSLFEALDETPETVGTALALECSFQRPSLGTREVRLRPDPYGLAALPSTEDEQAELLSALTARHGFSNLPRQFECAALLQEAWGRPREALQTLETCGQQIDPLHLCRLRHRCRDAAGAAEAFARAQVLLRDARPLFPHTIALTRPFQALGRRDELAAFLAWLQPQCATPAMTVEILLLRLNNAWHGGRLTPLLCEIAAREGHLFPLAWWALSGDPAALPDDLREMPTPLLLEWRRLCPESPEVFGELERRVREGWGSVEDDLAALAQLRQEVKTNFAADRLTREWFARDEAALMALEAAFPRMIAGDAVHPNEPPTHWALGELADRHPENGMVNLLAGKLAPDQDIRGRRADFVRRLERAFSGGKLFSRTEKGLSADLGEAGAEPELAALAMENLVRIQAPAERLKLLQAHPDYPGLAETDRLRHLALAALDIPFAEGLLALDWSDPAHDAIGDWSAQYQLRLLSERRPSGEIGAKLRAALPEMLAGSAAKDAELIVRQANVVRGLFPDDEGFPELLADLAARLRGRAKERMEEFTGSLKPPAKEEPAIPPAPESPILLGLFSPPGEPRWLDPKTGFSGIENTTASAFSIRQVVFNERFPVESHEIGQPGVGKRGAALWKLRELLPPDAPQRLITDHLIVIDRIKPPEAEEEVRQAAQEHLLEACAAMKGLDAFIYRETSRMPDMMQVRWRFLRSAAAEPLGVRRRAVALQNRFGFAGRGVEDIAMEKLWENLRSPMPPPSPAPYVRPDRPPLHHALQTNDPDRFLELLAALPADDPGIDAYLAFDDQLLPILPGRLAEKLLGVLESWRLSGWRAGTDPRGHMILEKHRISTLHRFFLDVSPDLAHDLRRFLIGISNSSFMFNGFIQELLIQTLLEDLQDGGGKAAAVDLLAETALGFTALPQDPLLFHPAPPDVFRSAAANGLCAELAEALTAAPSGSAPADLMALLRYAAAPDVAAFERELTPFLPPRNSPLRSAALERLTRLLQQIPRGREHLLMHAEGVSRGLGFPHLPNDSSRDLSEWTPSSARESWRRLKGDGLDKQNPPGFHSLVRAMAPVMLEKADEALWEEFFPALEQSIAEETWGIASICGNLAATARRERALGVLDTLIRVWPERAVDSLIRTAWLLNDADSLAKLRRKLREVPEDRKSPLVKDAESFLDRDGMKVEGLDGFGLVFTIVTNAAGGRTLCWAPGKPQLAPLVFAGGGAVRDGLFDLEITRILGGERGEPLRLEAIPARGSAELPPGKEEDANDDLELRLFRRGEKDKKHSQRLQRPYAREIPLSCTPAADSPAPRDLDAPFSLMDPPVGVMIGPDKAVPLAEFSFDLGESLEVGMWIAVVGEVRLGFDLFDGNGMFVSSGEVGTAHSRHLPTWSYTGRRFSDLEPDRPGTLRLKAFSNSGGGVLWVTGLAIRPTEDMPTRPPGSTLLGRTQGDPSSLACTPDGAFLCVASSKGDITVMDGLTGASAAFPRHSRQWLVALAMGGGRVVGLDSSTRIWVMDLENGSIVPFGSLTVPGTNIANPLMEISSDGRWLVWGNAVNTLEIISLEKDGFGRRIRLPLVESPAFIMNRADNTIIAYDKTQQCFVIPVASLSELDPAALRARADVPPPAGVHREWALPGGDHSPGGVWRLPLQRLSARGAKAPYRPLSATGGEIHLPTSPRNVAAGLDGTLYFATPAGVVYKISPDKLPQE